jgi:diguanylate cyclase (GGDEF)-like protein
MQLDVPTMMAMEVASAALVGMILPSARDASKVPGFREATWGAWMLAGSFAAQLLRGHAPEVVPIAFGNGLLALATALHVRAYERFDGRREPARWPIPFAALASALLVALWALGVGYTTRAIVASVGLAVTTLTGAWVLARDGGLREERSRSICIGLGAFAGVCMLVRIGLLLAHPADDVNIMHPSLERSIAFFPAMLYTLGGGLGFLVMHRERSEARARELALTDPMTGCANRRALEDRVRGELDHARRTGRPVTVIVTDIDRFKRVNDTYGHAVGDEVIRHVAATIRGGIRTSDVVARYGGEEFCVLLRDADVEAAHALAERLRVAVRSRAVRAGRVELQVTASFGVAVYDATAEDSWEALFRRADAALYRAKESGRDRVESNRPPG